MGLFKKKIISDKELLGIRRTNPLLKDHTVDGIAFYKYSGEKKDPETIKLDNWHECMARVSNSKDPSAGETFIDIDGNVIGRTFDKATDFKDGYAKCYFNQVPNEYTILVYGGLGCPPMVNSYNIETAIAQTFKDPQFIYDNIEYMQVAPYYVKVFQNVVLHHYIDRIDKMIIELVNKTNNKEIAYQEAPTMIVNEAKKIAQEYTMFCASIVAKLSGNTYGV